MGRTHHTTTTGTARRTLALALIGVATLAACGGDGGDDAATDTATEAAATAAPAGDGAIEMSGDATVATDAPVGTAGTPGEGPSIDLGTIGRDVIVELHVQMETDDIARTVAAITADAVNVGGGVASSDISYGTETPGGEPNRDGHALLVLKVPPAEVGNVIAQLDGTGRVLSMNQSAQDVTDQLVDLEVRIANKRESVENVRKMMESTTDLSQLVTLEAELTWRQTELEQLEAQQRNLGDRVAMSTITIEIRPTATPVDPVAEEDDDSIADAFRQGWDAFREIALGIAFVLAALAPFIITALVIAGLAWTVTRVRNRPSVTAQPAPADDDELTPV